MSFCVGGARNISNKKVATSYVHTATHFNKEGMDVEVIHLNGSA